MFIRVFNTSIGGIIAHEIKIDCDCSFMFALGMDADTIRCEYDGTNIKTGDSSAALNSAPLAVAVDDRFGIEYDTSNGNYRIIHRNGTTDTVLESGTMLLSGDLAFIGLPSGLWQKISDADFQIANYAVGAKDINGVAI